MSQGDYLQQKKLKARLCQFKTKQTTQTSYPLNTSAYYELPAILSSQDYTDFAKFNVSTVVKNNLPTFSRLNTTDQTIVFDMPQPTSETLPTWSCIDTQTRKNRMLNPRIYNAQALVPGARPLTQKQKDTASCRSGYPFWTDTSGNMFHWPGDNRVKTKYTNPPQTPFPVGPLAPTVKTIMQPIYGGGYA